MTDEDRSRLDRIEQLLLEVLSELRGPSRKPAPSRRGRKVPASVPPVSDLDRARANRILDKLGLR